MIDKQLNIAALDEVAPTIVSTTGKEAPCLAIEMKPRKETNK